MIAGSVDIDRTPEDVFGYVADATRRPEWQDAVEKIEVRRSTPGGVGSRVRETRRVQGTSRTFTWEVTEYEPGRRYCFRGIDGPVRARVAVTLAPLDDGRRTRVHLEIDFDGVGIGKALAALARRGAADQAARDGVQLKRRLEA